MRTGVPLFLLNWNAPLASMLVKALIVRSSVLIWPLPRIPTQWHPATKAMHAARNTIVIFFMGNLPPVNTMQQRPALDSRICGLLHNLQFHRVYQDIVNVELCAIIARHTAIVRP